MYLHYNHRKANQAQVPLHSTSGLLTQNRPISETFLLSKPNQNRNTNHIFDSTSSHSDTPRNSTNDEENTLQIDDGTLLYSPASPDNNPISPILPQSVTQQETGNKNRSLTSPNNIMLSSSMPHPLTNHDVSYTSPQNASSLSHVSNPTTSLSLQSASNPHGSTSSDHVSAQQMRNEPDQSTNRKTQSNEPISTPPSHQPIKSPIPTPPLPPPPMRTQETQNEYKLAPPLHYTVKHNVEADYVRLLYECGADIYARDGQGRLAVGNTGISNNECALCIKGLYGKFKGTFSL